MGIEENLIMYGFLVLAPEGYVWKHNPTLNMSMEEQRDFNIESGVFDGLKIVNVEVKKNND